MLPSGNVPYECQGHTKALIFGPLVKKSKEEIDAVIAEQMASGGFAKYGCCQHGKHGSSEEKKSEGGHHGQDKKKVINACLITVSDRASSGEYTDFSGPAMRDCLNTFGSQFNVYHSPIGVVGI